VDRTIEYVPLEKVARADVNPKEHDLVLLEDSVTRWGYVEPIVVDERTDKLVAGHGRLDTLLAMKQRGMAPPDGVVVAKDGGWSVPVIRGWSSKDDKEAQAYLLASNRITERGGWDKRALVDVLQSLENDLAGVGFDQADVDDLLAKLQEAQDIAFENQRRHGAEARDEATYDEWADRYADSAMRSMVLDYPIKQFERVVELATKARADFGADSNADMIYLLLERHYGE